MGVVVISAKIITVFIKMHSERKENKSSSGKGQARVGTYITFNIVSKAFLYVNLKIGGFALIIIICKRRLYAASVYIVIMT